jgi:hypothetical protein
LYYKNNHNQFITNKELFMKLNKTDNKASGQTKKNAFGLAAICAALAILILAGGGCSTEDDPPPPPKVPKTWQTAVSGTTANIYRVAYGNGVFVVTGDNYAAWSSNGTEWTLVNDTSAFNTSNGRHYVYFGNGYFIAPDGRSGGNSKKWAKSSDGKIWTATGDTTNFGAAAGCYGNGKFLVSGSGGQIAYNTASDVSEDWTIIGSEVTGFTGSGGTTWINAIAFGNDTYVAGGGNGRIIWSTNADTWTEATVKSNGEPASVIFDGAGKFVGSIAFGGGRFIAIGGDDNNPPTKVAWSTDGKTWTESNLNHTAGKESGARYCSSAYGDGVFVMTARDGSASYSTDGDNWTEIVDIKFNAATPNGVCYGNGKFVIVGASGTIAYSIPE